ncbi:dsDNA nuclease domain-containing protein [Vibrio alginolyticus]
MSNLVQQEILEIANSPEHSETGGGHGQKGVDFQRYLAIYRLIELEESGAENYLVLLEAIQDVSEFDCCDSPSNAKIYQVKKKDRGEWSWNELTNLTKQGTLSLEKFKDSPIGKLCTSANEFEQISCEAIFISNTGCDIKLDGEGNVATSIRTSCEKIEKALRLRLEKAIAHICQTEASSTEKMLKNVSFDKAPIDVNNLENSILAHVYRFIEKRSPAHSNQASSFTTALYSKVAPLGAKTDKCHSFEELKKQHGITQKDFTSALASLQQLPDLMSLFELALEELKASGIGFMTCTTLKLKAQSYYQRLVLNSVSQEEKEFLDICDDYLKFNRYSEPLIDFYNDMFSSVCGQSHLPDAEKKALIILRVMNQCYKDDLI